MLKVGDKVTLGSSQGTIVKEMMGQEFVVRMNNGTRMGAQGRSLTLVEDVVREEGVGEEDEEVGDDGDDGELTGFTDDDIID